MLGDDLNELADHFNLDTLPEEFGGHGQPYSGRHWTNVMTSKENEEITSNNEPTIECTPQPNKLRLETEI